MPALEFALDRPEAVSVGFGTYVFSGWCFALESYSQLEVELIAGNARIPAYLGLPRPDVRKQYPYRQAANSGYVVRFHCPASIKSFSVVARLDGAELVMFSDIPVRFEAEAPRPASRLSRSPLLSVVLLESDSQPYFVKRSLDSIREQSYNKWELGLGGEFVILLSETDELPPHALEEIAKSVNEFPLAQLFYADDEKIDRVGVPCGMLEKPDFDKEVLLSSPAMGNLVAMRRDLLEQPLSTGWDLFIRASEKLDASAIRHIAKPLCRRRTQPESASPQTLTDHIQRTGKRASAARGLLPGSLRLKYEAPKDLTLGVFIRPEDGPFQAAIVQLTAGRRRLFLNEAADVCVFINGCLESLNHLFFEELIGQLMRPECDAVAGEGFYAVRRHNLGKDGLVPLTTPYAVAVFGANRS